MPSAHLPCTEQIPGSVEPPSHRPGLKVSDELTVVADAAAAAPRVSSWRDHLPHDLHPVAADDSGLRLVGSAGRRFRPNASPRTGNIAATPLCYRQSEPRVQLTITGPARPRFSRRCAGVRAFGNRLRSIPGSEKVVDRLDTAAIRLTTEHPHEPLTGGSWAPRFLSGMHRSGCRPAGRSLFVTSDEVGEAAGGGVAGDRDEQQGERDAEFVGADPAGEVSAE